MTPELIPHQTADTPKANVLITHGFGEHQGRYAEVVEALQAAGYDVYTYDQYGHGTAPGPRAQVDVGALINDHLKARQIMQSQARAPKTVLFGHSMGGVVTAASALINDDDVEAVVLSGPALTVAETPLPPRYARLAAQVARFVPSLPTTKLDAALVSRDPKVVEDYEHDPLNFHGPVPFLTASTMLRHGDEVLKRADHWTLPLLVFHGEEDALASVDGSWQLVMCAIANGAQAELVEVPGAYHEVFNEPQAPELRAQLVEWLESILQ